MGTGDRHNIESLRTCVLRTERKLPILRCFGCIPEHRNRADAVRGAVKRQFGQFLFYDIV